MRETVRKLKPVFASGGGAGNSGFGSRKLRGTRKFRDTNPETPAWSIWDLQNTNRARFGRKNATKIVKSKGKSMELGYGNAGEGRSTSLAMDPRIKTYQNASKSQIDPRHENWGYFWGFSKFMVERSNRREICGNLEL